MLGWNEEGVNVRWVWEGLEGTGQDEEVCTGAEMRGDGREAVGMARRSRC